MPARGLAPHSKGKGIMRFMQTGLVIVLVLLLLQGSAFAESEERGDRLYDALGYAMFAGSAGDLLSTQYALAQGGRELNPLQRDLGVRIGTTVAFPFVANYLSDELREKGHRKLSLWLRIALVGLKSYVIVHNLRAGP
jgi:hypothetical protein